MSKLYEESKVLDKRTDTNGSVHHQESPGLLQTLAVLIAQKLNVKRAPKISIVKKASVSMPMDRETFKTLFSRLPSAPIPLPAYGNIRFFVPVAELDGVMPAGWSENTFRTSTTCRIQLHKPVEVALLERKKVFFDHSQCLRCQGGDEAPVACKGVVREVVYSTTVLKVSFYRERSKQQQRKPKERIRLAWAKPRASSK